MPMKPTIDIPSLVYLGDNPEPLGKYWRRAGKIKSNAADSSSAAIADLYRLASEHVDAISDIRVTKRTVAEVTDLTEGTFVDRDLYFADATVYDFNHGARRAVLDEKNGMMNSRKPDTFFTILKEALGFAKPHVLDEDGIIAEHERYSKFVDSLSGSR